MTNSINDDVILKVIEKGLSSLGESTKQTVWHCLEKDFHFEKRETPEKIEVFQQTLHDIFGAGYIFLDTLFRNYLGEDTGEDLSNFKTFAESVASLRAKEPTEPVTIDAPDEPFISTNNRLPV